MALDFSKKGREELYKNVENDFNKLSEIKSDENYKYRNSMALLKQVLSYEEGYRLYESQLKILWDLKKNYATISHNERKLIGVNTQENEKRKEDIEKHEKFLRKMSSSFKEDLEYIMMKDPSVKHLGNFNPN